MQNLESDNILDWLLQVSGQAGRVLMTKVSGVLYPSPLTVTHMMSYNSISIARPGLDHYLHYC